MSDWIKFMGTAGARFVVSKQLRSSAGTWCCFKGKSILIDPGPGTLVNCFSNSNHLNPEELDAVILTHRHLDHSTDVNVMIEAMTRGTFDKRGLVFAPSDAVSGMEPVVFAHTRNAVEKLQVLREGEKYEIGALYFETPARHDHPSETYGLKFYLDGTCVSFIVDTGFFPALVEHYSGTDILIMNVVLKEPLDFKDIKHLNLDSALKLIEGIKPRVAVITHFGLTMLKQDPALLARELTIKTGIEVAAATDGLVLELEKL